MTAERFIVPIGPQHPALKEPGHFEFTVEGETVTDARVRLGYAHRGIEKATESRSWTQNAYLLERICGICSHVHALAYCLGVEKLAGVEAPPRAQVIRALVSELERMHSHLLWLGVAAHEAGFDTLFMYAWRDREQVMQALENLTGNRVNYSANVLGGVKCDVTDDHRRQIMKMIKSLSDRIDHYLSVVESDRALLQRTHGVGTLTHEQAESLGVTGPVARSAGVTQDLRRDAPYAAYADFPVRVMVAQSGDLKARFLVRLNEMLESIRLIALMLDHLPAGDLEARMPRKIKAGETISRVEAPRGELFYYIKSAGGDMPERVKVRTPTLANMASVIVLSVGHQLADIPMILAGIDPCFSCNDRMVTAITPQGNQVLTWAQVRQYGIDFYKRQAERAGS